MAAEGPQQIAVPGQGAGWLKRYQGGARRWRLALLNGVVRLLRVPALQASPPRAGDDLRQLEQRRLEALAAKGVHVPTILRSGPGELLLSDLGPTLAARLLAGDTAERLRLLGETALAIAAVHRRQVCLGQPLGRNITVDDAGRIGFLDFEDDPLEVMTLAQAQCRDWLFLAAGSLRHARSVPTAELSRALSLGLIQEKQHRFHVLSPSGPLWVNGDPVRLTQMIGNLLSNRAKKLLDRLLVLKIGEDHPTIVHGIGL